MIKTPSLIIEKNKSGYTMKEYEKVKTMKRLTRELQQDEINLLCQRYNEKKELSEAADLVRDFVNVLKEGMKNNYDDNNNNLSKIIKKQNYHNLTLDGSHIFMKFNSNNSMEEFHRKSIDSMKNRHSFNFKNSNIDYRKKLSKKISVKNFNQRLSISNFNEIKERKRNSFSNQINNLFGKNNNKEISIEINPPLDNIEKNTTNLNNTENKNFKNEDLYSIKKSIIELPKENKKKHKLSVEFKKSPINGIETKNSFISEKNENENKSLIQNSYISCDNIIKLNDLKNEIKTNLIGENKKRTIKEGKKYLFDDINESKIENEINEEDMDKAFIEQRYRFLQRKGYVYDSLDDEENIDEEKLRFFINPESKLIIIFDFFVTLSSLYYLIYIPYFLGSKHYFCQNNNFFVRENIIEIFIDIIFIIDLILPFFIAFYNFDEVLQTHFRKRSKKYLKEWFIFDLFQAIPFKTIFTLFDKKCKNKEYLISPIYHDEYHYFLLCIRFLKIFKIFSKNKFLDFLYNYLNDFEYLSNYLTIYTSVISFCITLHIVSNIFIFIGRNDYPNWIITFGYSGHSYYELYLIGIYYTIATLTTVGYGDLHCTSKSEKFFGIFMEVVGIFAYSFALTSVSNYVKVLHEKTEEYVKNCAILEEIKLTNPKLPEELYDKISRYLKYKHDKNQLDKNIIIDCLPVNLSNILIYEMYRPIIDNFVFFKNFDNIDFIVKVILNFKPILAMRNDVLIQEGDFVEDIIFIKKGKLSLELTLKKSLKENNSLPKSLKQSITSHLPTTLIGNQSFINNGTLFLQQSNIQNDNQFLMKRNSSIFQEIQTFGEVKKKKKKFFSRFRKKKKKSEKKSNVQTYKILEIRKNEHFGDILMFLNQRSPLSLRVKTKKAELFFLNKTDAIDISTSYPTIWEKINVKSLFNYEQIKRLMNKIIKIFNSSHGSSNLNSKYTIDISNSTLAAIENLEEEDELQSIPTLENLEDYDNDIITPKKQSFQKIKSKRIPLNSFRTIEENSSESNYSDNNNIIIEKSSEKSLDDDSQRENHKCTSSLSDCSNYTNRHKTKTDNYNNITPFKPEDINDEIYPDEIFINYPNKLIKENKEYDFNKDKNLKLSINNNYNNFNENISICSTEISFSIHSEYENIDELSDYKYSKDISLRNKIKKILKNEEEAESKLSKEINNNNSVFSENFSENVNSDVGSPNINNIKLVKSSKNNKFQRGKKKSISFLKPPISPYKILNNIRKTGTTEQDEKNLQIMNFQNKCQKNSNFIGKRKTKKEMNLTIKNKNLLLKTINKNIERNQINLNNPDLFYSEYFVKILGKKKEQNGEVSLNKEEEEFMNKLERKNTISISKINTLSKNFTNNFTSTFKQQI